MSDTDDYQEALNDREAYSSLDLQNKAIEPALTISKDISRNNALGNLTQEEWENVTHDNKIAEIYIEQPFEKGGYLTRIFGLQIKKNNDFLFVSSLSKMAKLRELMSTLKREHTYRDEVRKKRGKISLRQEEE